MNNELLRSKEYAEFSEKTQFAINLVKEAGDALLPRLNDSVDIKAGISNVVTAGDLRSHNIICESIQRKFPEEKILSEEGDELGENLLTVDRVWGIDPLDGSKNQADGIPEVNVSIAFVESGVIVSGAIYNPYTKQLYYAEKGKGAYYEGPKFVGSEEHIREKLSVSNQKTLSKATIETSISYDPKGTVDHQLLKLAMYSQEITPRFREIGSSVGQLARVARGTSDLHFHSSLKPWDYAAGMLMVEEAGGVNKTLRGDQATFMNSGIVSGNEMLVNQFTTIHNAVRGNKNLVAWIAQEIHDYGN